MQQTDKVHEIVKSLSEYVSYQTFWKTLSSGFILRYSLHSPLKPCI